MQRLLRFVLACAMVASVLGHARLTVPVPLNPNAVTSPAPCGIATNSYPTNPIAAATWAVGTTVEITWQLIAGDGGSDVYGAFDLTATGAATTSFTVDAWSKDNTLKTPTAGGATYTKAFTVPNIACNSTSGLCLFRAFSNTGWNSCIYVNITNCPTCPTPPPAPDQCKTATGLKTCMKKNGQTVMVPADSSATIIDGQVLTAYWAAINSTKVFGDGQSLACRQLFLDFLCTANLPPCPGSDGVAVGAATECQCLKAMETCQIQPEHIDLYQCNAFTPCAKSDSFALLVSSLFVALATFAILL